MAVYIECPHCHELIALKKKDCNRCGPLPMRDKVFWLRYKIANRSKKERLGQVSLLRAQQLDKARRLEIKTNHIDRVGGVLTLKFIWYAYLEKLRINSSVWEKTAKGFINRMLREWGDIPAMRLTPEMVSSFQLNLRKSGLAPASCDRVLAVGRAAWRLSAKNIPDPFSEVPFYRPDNRRVRYLSEDEEYALLAMAKKHMPMMCEIIITAICTGLRKRNILQLKRSEVDFTHGVLRLVQKGQQWHALPLHPALSLVLSEIPFNGTDYFWINPHTGRPFTEVRKQWARLKYLASIPQDFRFHDLRHHVASKIVSQGGSLKAVQNVLGHHQISTTERYAHLSPRYLEDTVKLLEPASRPEEKCPKEVSQEAHKDRILN